MNERRHMILAWVLIVTVVAAVAATVWLPLTEQAQRNHTRIASLDDRVATIQTLAATQAKLKTSLQNMERSIGSENSINLSSRNRQPWEPPIYSAGYRR